MDLRESSRADEALLEKIGRLRIEAWKTETPKAGEMTAWIDEFDRAATHWAVFDDDVLVAAARLTVHERVSEVPDAEAYLGMFPERPAPPIASLNRMVVHPCARGRGLSKRLDLIRLEAAEYRGCRSAILSTASGSHRVNQLMGWGFELIGYGPRFQTPPLSDLPSPAVLLCRFPRSTAAAGGVRIPAAAAGRLARCELGD